MNNKPPLILVAEDDHFYSKILRNKLMRENYEVVVAEDGQRALDITNQQHPDLILLDLIMPIMNGFSTLQNLKSNPETEKIKVVIISNLGQDSDRERAIALGAEGYFVKSDISINDLVKEISKTLSPLR